MKPVDSRVIRLPSFETDERITDRDFGHLNYAKRVALPNLARVKLIQDAVKRTAFEQARTEAGFTEELINDTFGRDYKIGPILFRVNIHQHRGRPGIQGTIEDLNVLLEQVQRDNLDGVRRDEVIKRENGAYMSPGYILSIFEDLQKEKDKVTRAITTQFGLDGEELRLDESISSFKVYYDESRYRVVNDANGKELFDALSLEARIRSFVDTFEERVASLYAPLDLDRTFQTNMELDDGSVVNIMLMPNKSTQWAKIRDGLFKPVDNKKGEKTIGASTGDVVIMNDLGFDASYEKNGRGKVLALVEKGRINNTGSFFIRRGEEVSCYTVIYENGVMRVRVNDVISRFNYLKDNFTHTNEATPLKVSIGYTPATPSDLL